jgi:hypothetical protein
MTDLKLPEPEDYRSDMAHAIHQTRQLIKEALGYIARQEDGPVTMRCALKDIDKAAHVDDPRAPKAIRLTNQPTEGGNVRLKSPPLGGSAW